ncbi:MAG: hypothetical protein ACI9QN_002764, partial [Arcticibacterium sp.]
MEKYKEFLKAFEIDFNERFIFHNPDGLNCVTHIVPKER